MGKGSDKEVVRENARSPWIQQVPRESEEPHNYLIQWLWFLLHPSSLSLPHPQPSETRLRVICELLLLLSRFSRVRLCNPIDGSPPDSPVPGILQARTLEWVVISFSNAWKWKVKVKLFSRVRLFVTPWTAAYQASLSMRFSRQEYWSGVPLP